MKAALLVAARGHRPWVYQKAIVLSLLIKQSARCLMTVIIRFQWPPSNTGNFL
jgi:hypothetical protein